MAELATRYGDSGLRIVAFPSGQFGNQELGTNAEIKSFVSDVLRKNQYSWNQDGELNSTFLLMGKTNVNGAASHPVFRYMKSLPGASADITWNFGTYWLFSSSGALVKRSDDVSPLQLEVQIGSLLRNKGRHGEMR